MALFIRIDAIFAKIMILEWVYTDEQTCNLAYWSKTFIYAFFIYHT